MGEKMLLFTILVSVIVIAHAYQTPRGAQVRISSKGLKYAADIAIERMKKELPKFYIGTKSGKSGRFYWKLEKLHIYHVDIPNYDVRPTARGALRVQITGVSLGIAAPLYYNYKWGWVKFAGTTNMAVKGSGIMLRLDIEIGADQGKPTSKARNCFGRIGDMKIGFSGGNVIATWILNIAMNILKPNIMNLVRTVMCKEVGNLINKDLNGLLRSLPVRQRLDSISTLDYSFIKTESQGHYFDFLLRGEFLSTKNPQPSNVTQPSFDISSDSDKMVYIWVTDWMLNTVGKVYEDARALRHTVLPTDSYIPKEVQPFLTTKGLKGILPDVYKNFPDKPIQFVITTWGDPIASAVPEKLILTAFPTISVQVQTSAGPAVQVLKLTLTAIAHGKVTVTNDYTVHAEIKDFKISGKADPPTFPVGNPMVEGLLQMLIAEKINPRLKKGFPLPKVKDLVLINPSVVYVQDAIRISSDVQYIIPLRE